jgi:hypothetical protein
MPATSGIDLQSRFRADHLPFAFFTTVSEEPSGFCVLPDGRFALRHYGVLRILTPSNARFSHYNERFFVGSVGLVQLMTAGADHSPPTQQALTGQPLNQGD